MNDSEIWNVTLLFILVFKFSFYKYLILRKYGSDISEILDKSCQNAVSLINNNNTILCLSVLDLELPSYV